MEKDEKLFIKLGLEKDISSGEITLNIRFDENAPNFTKEKDVISWNPSMEEWAFVNEVFEIFLRGRGYNHGKKPILGRNEAEEEDFIPPTSENEIVDKSLEKNK